MNKKLKPINIHGRLYDCYEFRTDKATNKFLEKHPAWGVVKTTNSRVFVAKITDKGKK